MATKSNAELLTATETALLEAIKEAATPSDTYTPTATTLKDLAEAYALIAQKPQTTATSGRSGVVW